MNSSNIVTISVLLEALKSKEPHDIIIAARALASRRELSASAQLRGILQSTDDPSVRNAVALALSDLGDRPTFDVLVDLLKSEKTRGNRGTLLYAIGTYDCSPILPLLVDFVIDGNFEVRNQAFSVISGIETEVDERTWQACLDRLRLAASAATDERLPLLKELITLFEQE